jgi:oligosaccharide 4-alpha-D-glucosyltransferase
MEGQVLCVDHQGGTYRFAALSDEIIRVTYQDSLTGKLASYAPIISQAQKWKVSQSGPMLTARTGELQVQIRLDSFGIAFLDQAGEVKLRDAGGFSRQADTNAFRFQLKPEEAIYGTGSHALPLNRRGQRLLCYNQPQYGYGWGASNLNYSLPQLMSSHDYMLLFDDPARAVFDIGNTKADELAFKSLGNRPAYYFIHGNSFSDLIGNYTELTGRQPLPPLWALGHLQSRFGYRSQQEAEEILDQALAAGYPVDAIVLDIYWFGTELEDGKMGQLSWDTVNWPDPKGMIEGFKARGVKTITVSEPFFTRKSQHYPYLSANKLLALDSAGNTFDMPDFYFGEGGLLDIFKPEAREWMWERYREMKTYGIDGWWVDLGEPEKHPDSMMHVNGPAYQVHGLYGHEWARMLHEGFEKDYPEERLFQMGRAGYAGTQRFGLIPWTGDVGRNWSGLLAQPSMMLSMGLSGIAYMHSDAGGFSVGEPDPELYTRWLQFAAFSPIFRPHADASIPPEPVFWDTEVQAQVKPFVELRYRMLPYNYTLAWENATTGMPFARPLFSSFPSVSDTVFNRYLWGENILVAPVLQAGQQSMQLQLPTGPWYDFWTGKAYAGEQSHSLTLSMDRIPAFVRGGSFVTTAPLFPNTEAYRTDSLIISYYHHPDGGEGKVYFDDGKTPDAYEKGQYQMLGLTAERAKEHTILRTKVEGGGYAGMPKQRKVLFLLHGLPQAPRQVTQDGKALTFSWDEKGGTLRFATSIAGGEEVKVEE